MIDYGKIVKLVAIVYGFGFSLVAGRSLLSPETTKEARLVAKQQGISPAVTRWAMVLVSGFAWPYVIWRFWLRPKWRKRG